jgi:hypothetical protein
MMKHTHKFLWVGLMLFLMLTVSSGLAFAQDPLQQPTFTDPTNVTNLYFPKALTGHLISIGVDTGESRRAEEMVLPMTRTIEWGGGTVEAIVIYYIAYGNGQLLETAFDYYAQDDAGNVYYLGEEVTNYQDGQTLNHEGSWLVGRDGVPASVIMPANLQVGTIFYPENRPGLVFEQDKVLSLSEEIMTPRGLINDGMLIQETLMNGVVEFKTYAPSYGYVYVETPEETAQMALLNYTTDEHRVVPDTLVNVEARVEAIFDSVSTGDWAGVSRESQNIQSAWKQYLAEDIEEFVPMVFQDAMAQALQELQAAVAAKDTLAAQQAANKVSFAAVDLFTYYNPSTPSDLGRMDALERQVLIDLEAGDLTAATDTLAQASAIWVRLRPFVLAQDGIEASLLFETSLNAQVAAVANEDTDAVISEVANGLELVDVMGRLF